MIKMYVSVLCENSHQTFLVFIYSYAAKCIHIVFIYNIIVTITKFKKIENFREEKKHC